MINLDEFEKYYTLHGRHEIKRVEERSDLEELRKKLENIEFQQKVNVNMYQVWKAVTQEQERKIKEIERKASLKNIAISNGIGTFVGWFLACGIGWLIWG